VTERDGKGVRRTKLIELFDLARRGVELDLRVCVPATVKLFLPPSAGPYGPLPAMVQVEIDLEYARAGRAGDADPSVPERFKPLPGSITTEGELVGAAPPFTCPVMFPGFGAGWLRGPLLPGEQGLVHFTDRALGRWLVSARLPGVDLPVDPGEGATHGENLCDAFFVPGARNGPQTKQGSIPAEGVTLGTEDPAAPLQHELHLGAPESHLTTGSPTLTLDSVFEVLIGKGAVDLIAKADPVMQVLQLLYAALNTWVPVPNDGGLALKTQLGIPGGFLLTASALISQITATKGKVE
jgi:hypothetical protein